MIKHKSRKNLFSTEDRTKTVLFSLSFYRNLLILFLFTTVANLSFPQISASAQNKTPIEYKVKAAYIIKFFNFFHWASLNSTKPEQPYRIGVLGNSPVYSALMDLLKNQGGAPIELIALKSGESLTNLHFLFISKDYNDPKEKIFTDSQAMNILTIGEESSFCLQGGIINFVIVNEKIKFEINRQAANKSGIKVSSRILRAASKIYPESN